MTVTTEFGRIISADCHITEPPGVYDRVPEALRDRAPKVLVGADGGEGWSYDGGPPKRTLGVEAMAGLTNGKVSGLRYDEILPGNFDGEAHATDMTRDGIDVSIVYPSNASFIYVEPDRELAVACLQSYNDWIIDDFAAAAPGRIVGLPLLPVDDGLDTCLAEYDRVKAKGARGMFIPGNPVRPYHDPYYDPLYARAAADGTPLTFHRTFGGRPLEADWDELINQKMTVGGTVYRFFSSVRPFTYMVYGGVFQRHPGLKIVAAEVNCSWLPFWAETMDKCFDNPYYRETGGIGIDRRPSEHLGDNLFVTILDDDLGFRMISEGFWPALADCSMYSTDYPHSVCLWPNTIEHLTRLTAGMDPTDRTKVLSGNAARVYGL